MTARILGASIALLTLFTASVAAAAPPWVDRHVTLPEHDWAFDVGLGVAHQYTRPGGDVTGVGVNLEMGVSPVDGLELGLRTGARVGDDTQRLTRADAYGRLFDRQTFGTVYDTFANPEFRIRGAIVRSRVAEVALEGRVFLPLEHGSELGLMFGVPLLFHIGNRVRLDTGVFTPVLFYNPIDVYVSAPIDVWIQATNRLWLGPMSGFVYYSQTSRASVPLGFGLGYQFTHYLDLKTQFLFPHINQTEGAQTFGVGVGVQIRIE